MTVCALVGTHTIYALIIGIRKWVRKRETSNKNIEEDYTFIYTIGEKERKKERKDTTSPTTIYTNNNYHTIIIISFFYNNKPN